MAKLKRLAMGLLVVGFAVLGVRACQLPNPLRPDVAETEGETSTSESGLTLRDVTLEQPDDNGELLWKVKGEEVTYSPDRQVAFVKAPDGELYQDGELIYTVQGDTGEIRDNGKVIFLRGNIVATGIESQAVLKGNELEWRPEEDRLIISQGIRGSHPQIQAQAQRAEVFNREKRILLEGDVVATTVNEETEDDSRLKLQAQRLQWFWQEERLESDQPLLVEQFEGSQVTNSISGDQGQFNLASMEATLEKNVAMQLPEFPLQGNSEKATWQVEQQQVQVDQPLRLIQSEEEIVVTAQSGRIDLAAEQVYLFGDVVAKGQQRQTQLASDRLTWDLNQDTLTAEGNVTYQQVDPQFRLRGAKAVAQIQNQNIIVQGGPVVTEIVPNAPR